MAKEASTRAEWLRAISAEVDFPLQAEISLTCEGCSAGCNPTELKEAGSVRCPGCGGTEWTLVAVVSGDYRKANKAFQRASTVIGLALGDVVLPSLLMAEMAMEESGFVRARFRETQVDARLLLGFLPLSKKERIDPLLTFLHGRELTTYRRIHELVGSNGVECLACRGTFAPRIALEQAGIDGVWPFDDTTCSNRCRRTLREATQVQTCPVCSKVFVPPPRPAIDRDWERKEWHANGYCTKSCYEGRERLRTCGACREQYVIPKSNPLAKHSKKSKAWHEAGYCSKACQSHPESFQDCSACAKRFQLAPPNALSKKKPKPWHTAGFCSKACRDDPAPAPSGRVAVSQAPASCSAGHTFEVPITHAGLRTTCPECRVTVAIPG